jgi:exopolysaccharide biosynthesis polyprenyl glycosylphosphotransferase
MAEPEILPDRAPVVDGTDASAAEASAADTPLLTRLNRRGFRLVMLADALVLLAVIVGSMIVQFRLDWPTYPVPTYLGSFATITAIFIASLYFGGLYEREPRLGAPPTLPRAVRQTLAAGGLVALINLVLTAVLREFGALPRAARALPLPIQNLVALILIGAAGIAANRWLVHRLRTRREGPPKVLLAGQPSDLEVARTHLESDAGRAMIVAEVSEVSELLHRVRETEPSDVVLVSSGWVDDLYPRVVRALDRAGITMLLRVSARETLYGLERIREVGGLPFVLLRAQTMPRSRARFKRLVDLALVVVAAPVLVVLIALVALHQLVVAGRPLLYRQTRVGARGEPFEMVKFRTMTVGAEEDGGPRLAELADPRIIPRCRWIRETRMDELPQLWNVLRGEMSLVGPRPERPELTADFERSIPGYSRRYELPPGLTGLAQIHGRYHTDPEYKLGYDLQYLVNWSPVLDLQILVRTVWVVLARRI